MAGADNYTRLVQIAKITLPLVALAILSTLFLLSKSIDPEAAIPYADVDVEGIARDQLLTNPRYASVGVDGAAIELSAQEARPNPDFENRLEAEKIEGKIDLPNGTRIDLSATRGIVDLTDQTAVLSDSVLVTATSGYRIATDALISFLSRAELRSEGPVIVETPFGQLQAGNMALTQAGGDYRLVFNNKVKLVYVP